MGDIESAFSLGQVASAYTQGQAFSRRKSVADIKPDADTQSAFSLGQRLVRLERAFSLGQTSGAVAAAGPSVDDDDLAIRMAEAAGKGAAWATADSNGDTAVDEDIKRAFVIGQTMADIESAFSLGQTSGASATANDDTSVDADIESAFSLGQVASAYTQGQAFSRRKSVAISSLMRIRRARFRSANGWLVSSALFRSAEPRVQSQLP